MKYKYFFIIIILIASFLRLYSLDAIPSGVYADEASSGYDAYSVLKTGKDRYGVFMPLLFRSFDDYIPPLYNFSIIPFIYLFDLNAFSIRLPAAIFGILCVILTFYITRKLFNEKVALIAAFLIAVSPWHIQYSRIAFPAISFLFMFLLMFFFLLKSLQRKRYLILAAASAGLCFYTYAISKLFIPLFLLGFFIIYRDYFGKKRYKIIIFSLIVFLIVSSLPFFLTFYGGGGSRFDEVSIFNEDNVLKTFFSNYLSYYNPNFLFFNGDLNLRHSINGIGQLYWFEFVLFIVALLLFTVLRKKENDLMLYWFLIFPIAAALTNEGNPHATRAIIALPLFQILSAYSLFFLYGLIKNLNKRKMIYASLFILFLFFSVFNIGYYFNEYYSEYPVYSKRLFEDKLKESFEYLEDIKGNYDKIVISDSIIPQTYIYILFYTKFDPGEFQKNGFKNSKYRVANVWTEFYESYDFIYLARAYELKDKKEIKVIYYNDGEEAFRII